LVRGVNYQTSLLASEACNRSDPGRSMAWIRRVRVVPIVHTEVDPLRNSREATRWASGCMCAAERSNHARTGPCSPAGSEAPDRVIAAPLSARAHAIASTLAS